MRSEPFIPFIGPITDSIVAGHILLSKRIREVLQTPQTLRELHQQFGPIARGPWSVGLATPEQQASLSTRDDVIGTSSACAVFHRSAADTLPHEIEQSIVDGVSPLFVFTLGWLIVNGLVGAALRQSSPGRGRFAAGRWQLFARAPLRPGWRDQVAIWTGARLPHPGACGFCGRSDRLHLVDETATQAQWLCRACDLFVQADPDTAAAPEIDSRAIFLRRGMSVSPGDSLVWFLPTRPM